MGVEQRLIQHTRFIKFQFGLSPSPKRRQRLKFVMSLTHPSLMLKLVQKNVYHLLKWKTRMIFVVMD